MKIIVVTDMQNDFIIGTLGSKEAVVARDNLVEYLATLDEDDIVIFTRDTHFEASYFDTQEGKRLPILHTIYGGNGWKVDEKLTTTVKCEFYFLDKYQFASVDLPKLIRNLANLKGVDEIIFCGVCTDICVISNALLLKANFPEVPMKVIANCCAGLTTEKHEAALEVMRSCQIDVI